MYFGPCILTDFEGKTTIAQELAKRNGWEFADGNIISTKAVVWGVHMLHS